MARKPTRVNLSVLAQLCNLIPAYLVSQTARDWGVDKKARTFRPWSHVVALLYAQFTHALSLHDVCDALRNHAAKLLRIRGATAPSKNAFSHANRTRDGAMAQALFWAIQVMRRVRAVVEINGEEREMEFLTNNFAWAASSIAELYKSRRQIEVFFKEIKQTLQLCDFLGHNKNAVLWQVWTALILYILLRFLAFANSWRHGFKRFFCLLRSSVWDGFPIARLAVLCGTAGGAPPMRAAPEQLYLPGFAPQWRRA